MLACVAALAGAGAASAMDEITGPLQEAGFTGYVQQQALPFEDFERWPGLRVKRLSADPDTGRLAVLAEFPVGYAAAVLPAAAQSLDLVMLDGGLRFGDERLGPFDFAFVPPGSTPPPLAAAGGAHALLFFDPPVADAELVARQRERGSYITRFDPDRWEPAAVAKAAGADIDLKIMHLKQDPDTTARTWYVRLYGDMTVPWEVHSMPEEGYVMEGGYRLAECLPGRTVIGDYARGGYFWRPGGIPHSGPESGPKDYVIWLQRSPVALDVSFYQGCEAGTPGPPIAR